ACGARLCVAWCVSVAGPVFLVKFLRFSSVRAPPILAMSSPRHARQLSPAITLPSNRASASASRIVVVGFISPHLFFSNILARTRRALLGAPGRQSQEAVAGCQPCADTGPVARAVLRQPKRNLLPFGQARPSTSPLGG